ncbi:MAG: (deoxy)nucleoside triphosphate pyrophosphohydrolase [Chloracidobacterium sp.]|nr:(deoxy)nucleoside triphosphate pyrophosphohydrolase [Chloracidobacterium sp.]MDW8217206.1 (deoxy)nucleoside triphosphate pyrophosphohydrolase [Acidobacteriota bacterium]
MAEGLQPTTTLVAAAVCVDGPRVLLTQRPAGGRFADQWEFPGGKLHWGEEPEAGLRRELEEELGVEITVGRPLHVIHYALDAHQAFAVVFYWARIIGGTISLRAVQDARWLQPAEMDDLAILPPNRPVVARLRQWAAHPDGLRPQFD